MSELVRLSVSLEQSLLDKLEGMLDDAGYANRSEFFRDLIREKLVEQDWQQNAVALGTITLIYNHHARNLSEKLTGVQHDHHDAVLATTHVHLDHDLCAEMIMVKGKAAMIRAMADQLRQQKGVLHTGLTMSSTGETLA